MMNYADKYQYAINRWNAGQENENPNHRNYRFYYL
jgi:hypothetical protein